MCGICGLVKLNEREGLSGGGVLPDGGTTAGALRAMAATLLHRGPDDEGYHVAGPVGLGFRRLSIIDLAGGHQPMSNEDGTVWIVFNGEIYNHADLRPELERAGHRYATRSDTETILHAYEEYGDDCVHRLRGMFAFAIWDARKRRLFCARDRLGVKPFYYAFCDGHFAFASEIKALLELPWLRRNLNRRALPEFFALGYLSSDETLFDGVQKLLPGQRLNLSFSEDHPRPRIETYWDLDVSPDESLSNERDCVARFEELFNESVRLRLMSDVPLGVFLSGGLDSSSIAAVMARLCKDPIQTFSVGYADDRFSELPYARIVADRLGAVCNEVVMGPDDFLASLPGLIWHEDEPLVWPSSVALYFVSRLAREKVKVVLTGEGSDEVFAGYLKYRVTLWNFRYGPIYRRFVPEPLRGLIAKTLESPLVPDALSRRLRHTFLYHRDDFEKLYFDNFYSVFPQQVQSRLFTRSLSDELAGVNAYANSASFFAPNGHPETLLSRLLYLDIKTYLVELLMKQDQMSMAASIESRVPFLDHKLVEFAARLPARLKVRFLQGKYLLRRAMEDKLPPEVLQRAKKGFPTPIRPWLRHRIFERVAGVLTDGRLAERRLVDPAFVRDLLEAHRAGRTDATDAIWRLLNFELWNRIFFDRDPALQLEAKAVGPSVAMRGYG